jgi:hypothetical protein
MARRTGLPACLMVRWGMQSLCSSDVQSTTAYSTHFFAPRASCLPAKLRGSLIRLAQPVLRVVGRAGSVTSCDSRLVLVDPPLPLRLQLQPPQIVKRPAVCDRRLSLLALFLLTAGCGGGGGTSEGDSPPVAGSGPGPSPAPSPGSSPGPAPSPSSQTGSISGVVSSLAGAPVQGVQVVIGGAGSASTVTNSAGAYAFGDLAPGSYSVEPRASGLIFSPSASSAAVVVNSETRTNFSATYQSTGSISNYMAALQVQVRSTFSAREDALSSQLAAIGQFRSGNHYGRSIAENFLPMVDSFLSGSIQFIQDLGSNTSIDSQAIANLYRSYSAADVEYSRTYYSVVNWGLSESGLSQILADLKGQIEIKYTAPIAQFQ